MIGENIRAMRRRCGFTQEELAGLLSVTPQAVSKWENGNGMPDLTQIVPLAQIFGITTDTLLGVVSATCGEAHTEAAKAHVRLLMRTAQSPAEKSLAAYTYMRTECEKEPTNYTIMRLCINYAADISRYADFEGFLSDLPDFRDEIFADCERRNICIARYCEDKTNVEKSDYAMAWIDIHIKRFDKAKALIDRLPSLESTSLREHMLTKLALFQSGFDAAKAQIPGNIRKLLSATGTELFNDFETCAWFGDPAESITLSEKLLGVLNAYKAFDSLRNDAVFCEVRIRQYLPRCYAASGDLALAEQELVTIADLLCQSADAFRANGENPAADAEALLERTLQHVEGSAQEQLRASAGYAEAVTRIRTIR